MSKDLNRFTCTGRLGQDIEMRYTPGGEAIAQVRLAVSDAYKDKNSGQTVDKTEWVTFKAFGKLAEICGLYLKKGSKIYAEGKLETREWEKDGIKRYATEIKMENMLMLDSKPAEGSSVPRSAPASSSNSAYRNSPGYQPAPCRSNGAPPDDDIPFDSPYRGRRALAI